MKNTPYNSFMKILVNNFGLIALVLIAFFVLKVAIPVYQLIEDNASQSVTISHISAKVDKLAVKVDKVEITEEKHINRLEQNMIELSTDLLLMRDDTHVLVNKITNEQIANKRMNRDIANLKVKVDKENR
jgi:hypothetical protein